MSEIHSAAVWQPPSLRVVDAKAEEALRQQQREAAAAQAYEDAKRQGYEEGVAKGFEEGRQQARQLVSQMNAVWDAMQQPFADMEHEVHAELMGLVVAMSEAVIGHELKTDKQRLFDALERCLEAVADMEGAIEIALNPRDIDLVAEYMQGEGVDHRLKPEPNLMPGGCRLRRGSALVDASVDTAIHHVLQDMLAETVDDSSATDSGAIRKVLDVDEVRGIADRFAKHQRTEDLDDERHDTE